MNKNNTPTLSLGFIMPILGCSAIVRFYFSESYTFSILALLVTVLNIIYYWLYVRRNNNKLSPQVYTLVAGTTLILFLISLFK